MLLLDKLNCCLVTAQLPRGLPLVQDVLSVNECSSPFRPTFFHVPSPMMMKIPPRGLLFLGLSLLAMMFTVIGFG